MSCWRVLELSDEPQGEKLPQLLIKPKFGPSTYTVFLTDLSNIWCEELELPGIVRRAAEVESPIEVSERHTAQLAILFENVRKSLDHNTDSTCIVTCDEPDGLTLHTTISLPEPLDSLAWKFHLRKKTAITLKDELILPLLVSSHIQHERISGLLSIIADKDRAITRLVDQFESSNLDLAAAFPSIGNIKSGRRVVKREQAAKHIPGLQNFEPDVWRNETAKMVDTCVSTLGLFQEALSECTPNVPPKLKSDDDDTPWWRVLNTSNRVPKRIAASKANASTASKVPTRMQSTVSESETEEDTEDEFETHENFKSRDMSKTAGMTAAHTDMDVDATTAEEDVDMDRGEDDDEDLDAPLKSEGRSRKVHVTAKSPVPEPSPPELSSPPAPVDSPPKKPRTRGFKIGGNSKKLESSSLAYSQEASRLAEDSNGVQNRPIDDEHASSTKPVKKGFKIGGRSKAQAAPLSEERAVPQEARPSRASYTNTHSPSLEHSVSSTNKAEKQSLPAEEQREETEQEKVGRKRRELKRKNEELAKKQAQSKKKKRF
ncbi:XLF-domain-containing protein [Bimuria novae-zelandiae CBS 107.79]|uniref:Non-homologous end-joining factor 1 n=1 Tax=Bimuria novae-zelandiae CBS 107.79 TaxID=1447943 RepID=A0A6A5W0I6_9PLEO|nr:XLF-domain-containing protein [Bimuria novae-zelandiae CBS 107.79]